MKNWKILCREFSSIPVLNILLVTSDSVLSSIATALKLSSSMLSLVWNTKACELLECTLPEKVKTGSLVVPSHSEMAKLIITMGIFNSYHDHPQQQCG